MCIDVDTCITIVPSKFGASFLDAREVCCTNLVEDALQPLHLEGKVGRTRRKWRSGPSGDKPYRSFIWLQRHHIVVVATLD